MFLLILALNYKDPYFYWFLILQILQIMVVLVMIWMFLSHLIFSLKVFFSYFSRFSYFIDFQIWLWKNINKKYPFQLPNDDLGFFDQVNSSVALDNGQICSAITSPIVYSLKQKASAHERSSLLLNILWSQLRPSRAKGLKLNRPEKKGQTSSSHAIIIILLLLY